MKVLTQARRDAIVAAAAEVFLEIGYERASMDEVARRAGGSKATLYKYFSSKETMFETVVRNYSARFLTEAANGLAQPENRDLTLEQKLTRFGEDMLRVVASDNQALQIYRVVLGESGHSDIGQLFLESGIRQSMESLAQEMSAAMERGELAPANPMLRAIQFTTLVKAETEVLFFLRELPHFTQEKISEMVANGLQLFLNGAVKKTE
ncbi:TetR/AcrR family transcriptional regulator [Enterobacter sp. Tr-810]|uniref:TetR/AcrR family transcriptional regulator n=1 Tax=Enterobacter sp. Tr-810 TaxID=2608347 RepID=UPI0014191A7E|nr:TetR/AcrR family transcriptional regulator [Enterobacter sp. Tr-810]NIF35224.1 TetR/AcrR family transcriptional regulator [Enterobacter sp. Tr-810]